MNELNRVGWHKHLMSHCKHFDGIQNETCKAGVNYETVTEKALNPRTGIGIRLACYPGDQSCMSCDKYQGWQLEEALAEEARREVAIQAHLTKLATDICPHCDTPVEKKVQAGSCVYAEPCGHRLYQGKAPKTKRVKS